MTRCADGQHYFLRVEVFMTGTTAAIINSYACFECGVTRAMMGATLNEYDLTTGGWIPLNGQEQAAQPAPRQRKR